MKRRMKALLCTVFGHKFADTQITYNEKNFEGDWESVIKAGPATCRRCLVMVENITVTVLLTSGSTDIANFQLEFSS